MISQLFTRYSTVGGGGGRKGYVAELSSITRCGSRILKRLHVNVFHMQSGKFFIFSIYTCYHAKPVVVACVGYTITNVLQNNNKSIAPEVLAKQFYFLSLKGSTSNMRR